MCACLPVRPQKKDSVGAPECEGEACPPEDGAEASKKGEGGDAKGGENKGGETKA